MSEPCKLFSVVIPFERYKQLKTIAKENDVSLGKTIRIAIDSFLDQKPKTETKG